VLAIAARITCEGASTASESFTVRPLFTAFSTRRLWLLRVALAALEVPADMPALEHAGVERQRLEPVATQQFAAARQLGHQVEHRVGQIGIDELVERA